METITSLKEAYQSLKNEQPNVRIREAAKQLQTTELQLLCTQIGITATPLINDFQTILSKIEELGHVMALSRNDEVVHERKGVYSNFSATPHAWLFVGADIDLRIFPACWKYGFAVQEGTNEQPRFSLQFFAKDGSAVHKIYMEKNSNMERYHELVQQFVDTSFEAPDTVDQRIALEPQELPDSEIDQESFKNDWTNLKDTHDFFGLLRKYRLTRTQALRFAPSQHFAKQVSNDTLRKALNLASSSGTSIMVFVGNAGMIQIHTGKVEKIVDHGPWLNVLDPSFNLHVKEDAIAQTWIVRKPTEDGDVTSIELFNNKGELICTLFGERKPGKPELAAWRSIVEQVQ